jgi:hypothetical protein
LQRPKKREMNSVQSSSHGLRRTPMAKAPTLTRRINPIEIKNTSIKKRCLSPSEYITFIST